MTTRTEVEKILYQKQIKQLDNLINLMFIDLNISIIKHNNTLHACRNSKFIAWNKIISIYNKGVQSKYIDEVHLGAKNGLSYRSISIDRKPITATRKELYKALKLRQKSLTEDTKLRNKTQ